jgi:hypothetical protein
MLHVASFLSLDEAGLGKIKPFKPKTTYGREKRPF